jgi:hypothetical protein
MDPSWSIRIIALAMCVAILYRMAAARRGKQYFIRRIAGIDAIEEAVGRATEMGKPIVFSPGSAGLDNMQTLAGLAVLSWVAKRCVQMSVRVLVPLRIATVVSIAGDILREAFREADSEDSFEPNDVRFLSEDQNAYAAGTIGMISREGVASAFYFGSYGFESLLIAENGRRLGVVQIAATADYFQIPFFICACDYTLIGEELYAASAYLSRDPVQVGTVAGQDIAKMVILLLIVFGSFTAIFTQGELNPVAGILGR